MKSGKLPKVSWEKIIEHIDHAVKVAGADHVGLGSDFDGATMPIGMEDASKLPKITDALLKKGYSEADVDEDPRRQPPARHGAVERVAASAHVPSNHDDVVRRSQSFSLLRIAVRDGS